MLEWMYVHYIHVVTYIRYCSVKFLCRVLRSTSVGNLEIAVSPRKDPPALTFGSVYHCGVVRHGWRERGMKVPRSNITARNRGNRREFVLKWLPNMHDKKEKAIIACPAWSRTRAGPDLPDLHAAATVYQIDRDSFLPCHCWLAPCSLGRGIFKCPET
jgi:hypothetical protein